MVIKTKDKNELKSLKSCYTVNFDMNLINSIISSMNEGRDYNNDFCYGFNINNTFIKFEYDSKYKTTTKTIKNDIDELIIKSEKDFEYYYRAFSNEIFFMHIQYLEPYYEITLSVEKPKKLSLINTN